MPCVQDWLQSPSRFYIWTKSSPPVPISKKWRLFQSRECEEMCVGGQSGSYNECVCMGTWGSLRFWGSISCSGSRCLTQSRKHSVFPVFLGWDTFSQSQAQGLIWIYQSCRLKIGHMHNLCCTNMVKAHCVFLLLVFLRALGGVMHDWLQHTNCLAAICMSCSMLMLSFGLGSYGSHM